MPKEDGQWKPGQSGNPSGRPKVPDDVKAIRKLSPFELERIINKYLQMDAPQIKSLLDSQTLPMREAYIASILLKGLNYGDPKRFDFILNRLIGKVTEHVQHHVTPTVIEKLEGGETILGIEKEEEAE